MMQWITAHQVLLIAMWPLLTAVVSLFYKQLDTIPRVHAVLSALTALGIDLPKLWEALGRIVTGNPPASGGPGTGGKTAEEKAQAPKANPSSFPKAPAAMRIAQALAMAVFLSFVTMTTGCAAWWQEFQNNPGQAIGQFISYVQSFLQAAQSIWTMIMPLLGTNAPSANALFNDAMVTANNSLAALQDGVNAAIEAKQSNPDFGKLMADVQDAVAHVETIIQQFRATTHLTAGPRDALNHQASVIVSWRR
jgi:hypothetical protein